MAYNIHGTPVSLLFLFGGVGVMDSFDDGPRVRPSGRNGNCLPLRMPGERIGGRQKGTPNKRPAEFEAAVIVAADAIGRPKRVGKIWVVTGKGGYRGFFAWIIENYPKVVLRLLWNFIVLEEESLKRLHNKARLSCVMEVLKVLMIPVELKPLHTTAHPSCVLELLELLAHSAARRF